MPRQDPSGTCWRCGRRPGNRSSGLWPVHVLGVGQDRLQAALFEDVKNRNPIFARGFHADILHAVAFEPFCHAVDIAVRGPELPDIKDCVKGYGICLADGSHKDLFMNVNARADRALDVTVSGSDDTCAVIHGEGFYLIKRIGSFGPNVFSLWISFFCCHMLSPF